MTGEPLEQYADGGDKLLIAIRGMTAAELAATPVPGKWSTHQVVVHLMDAEMAFADRIKRTIATDNPPLLAWDENAFAANLRYAEQSIEDAIVLVQIVRRQIVRVLRELPESTAERSGIHSERGRQTLTEVIGYANRHLDHHLKFVAEKRAALGI